MSSIVDIERLEHRFSIPRDAVAAFGRKLSSLLLPIVFSNKPYSQTVYLNNDTLPVPWGTLLRARNYLGSEPEAEIVNSSAKWFCELKREWFDGSIGRSKDKMEMSLEDFCLWANSELGDLLWGNVKPHVMTFYHRSHYVGRDGQSLRVTFDRDLRFATLRPDNTPVWIGSEKGARVEIKVSAERANCHEVKRLLGLLKDSGALPVISKKDEAFNLLCARQGSISLPPTGKNQVAIEAKFQVISANPRGAIRLVRQALLSEKFTGFCLKGTPSVGSRTSYDFPYEARDGDEEILLSYRGQSFDLFRTLHTQALLDTYGMDCLSQRCERYCGLRANSEIKRVLRSLRLRNNPFARLTPLHHSQRNFKMVHWITGQALDVSLHRQVKDETPKYWITVRYPEPRIGCHMVTRKDVGREITEDLAWQIFRFANKEAHTLDPVGPRMPGPVEN